MAQMQVVTRVTIDDEFGGTQHEVRRQREQRSVGSARGVPVALPRPAAA